MKKIYSLLAIALFGFGNAQINIATAGVAVTENFDGMTTAATSPLPTNWTAGKSNTLSSNLAATAVTGVATEQTLTYNTAMSSAATNGIWNFGGNSATDRAVGGLSSASSSKTIVVMTQIKNTSGADFSSINVSFDAERYRNGSNAAGFKLALWYSTDGTTWTDAGLTATFVANADNNGATTNPMETISKNGSINQTLTNNATMYLQWVYSVASSTTTSNSQALGLDNVSIKGIASTTLSINDFNIVKSNFVKNTLVKDEINFGAKAEVKVYNLNGQMVKSASVSESKNLNVEDLTPGMYFVTGFVEGKPVSQKILKK